MDIATMTTPTNTTGSVNRGGRFVAVGCRDEPVAVVSMVFAPSDSADDGEHPISST
ncbi:hypothetical protein [Nonomuraea sp. NPDC001699]